MSNNAPGWNNKDIVAQFCDTHNCPGLSTPEIPCEGVATTSDQYSASSMGAGWCFKFQRRARSWC